MEENNVNQENNLNNEEKHIHHHCWKMCIAVVCAAFLGGFLAAYFVLDQMMERMHPMHFNPQKYEKRMFNDMDRMYKNDMKAFEKAFDVRKKAKKMKKAELAMPVFMMDSVRIKTEFDNNAFNIIVDLKQFQDDENKVNYNVDGRKLTVFGNSSVKDRDYEHDVAFSEDFILPENADTENITKTKDGHRLIISVPIKE